MTKKLFFKHTITIEVEVEKAFQMGYEELEPAVQLEVTDGMNDAIEAVVFDNVFERKALSSYEVTTEAKYK